MRKAWTNRHKPSLSPVRLSCLDTPCESKVADLTVARERGKRRVKGTSDVRTNLEIAVGIEEKVRGLEVSVNDIGRVKSFESSESLVDEVLESEEQM